MSAQDEPTASRFAHRLSGRPSLTAEAVTVARAIEHLRPEHERIVDDPYAELFLGRAGRAAVAAWRLNGPATRLVKRFDPGGITFVACRHRYIDDALLAALDEGAAQVVLLGAGYDARAYRHRATFAGRPCYEVDLAPISRRKAGIVSRHRSTFPDADVRRVEIDFETQTLGETLAGAGFQTGGRTFVSWEGVSMYLTRSAVKATVSALADLCGTGSTLAMDGWYLDDDPGLAGTALRIAPGMLSVIGEAVTFGIHPEEMPCFLERFGWGVTDVATPDVLQQRYAGPDRPVSRSVYVLTAHRST